MRPVPLSPAAGLLALLATSGAAGAQPAGTGPGQPPPLLEMQDGRPTLNLGGGTLTIQPLLRLDGDFGGFRDQPRYFNDQPPRFLDSSRSGVPDHGLAVRRARVGLQGTFLNDFTYTFTWEFGQAPGSQFNAVELSRLYELQVAYTGWDWITARVGAYTLAHTIEAAMSSFELPFMERPSIIAVATSLASGDSRLAVGGEARGERWFASAYISDGSSTTLNDGRQRGLVGRANAMVVDAGWAKVVLGVNGALQLEPGTRGAADTFRLRDYPELRLDPTRLLDTGSIAAGSGHAIGPELSALLGPLYLQAEYQQVRLDGARGGPDRSFRGYYVTATLPLVGAPRRHDRARGVFTRPRFEELNPRANEWGWLELAARYSHVSLNDGTIRGGTQGITSVGLNYYPATRLRLTLQYSNGAVRLDGPDRSFQAVAGRVSFNW